MISIVSSDTPSRTKRVNIISSGDVTFLQSQSCSGTKVAAVAVIYKIDKINILGGVEKDISKKKFSSIEDKGSSATLNFCVVVYVPKLAHHVGSHQ